MTKDEDIQTKLNLLTDKLRRLANRWKEMPAAEYISQHEHITAQIDRLLDEAQNKTKS